MTILPTAHSPDESSAERLAADDNGAMLVMFGVSFALILGIVALSFDLGRVGITRTELQSFADNVALAAAGELDGNADAITRATDAASNFILDSQTFATGSTVLQGSADYTLTFLEALPDDDTTAVVAITTDPEAAVYARVVVNDHAVHSTFGAAFSSLTGQAGMDEIASATAVAGFTQYACDVTPMMFCLPSPNYKADANVGKMVRLRSGGQGAAWGPGAFGFLDPQKVKVDDQGPCAGKNGVKLDACLLAAEGSVTQCFGMRGVDIEPGQKVGIEDAILNVRFDIYKSIMKGERNDPDYPPAPNVIKGIVPNGGNSCIGQNEVASPDTAALPRDTCFGTGACGRFGDGDWTAGRANYVKTNYAGTDPHPSAKTRYAYYVAEIAAAGGAGSGNNILNGMSETGRPQCSVNQSSDPDRRVIVAAGIDCVANSINGAATGVPVKEFFKIFLTEPVGQDATSPPRLDIWGEVVGSAGGGGAGIGGSDGIFRDVAQLYR